jgi:hypothetical protein
MGRKSRKNGNEEPVETRVSNQVSEELQFEAEMEEIEEEIIEGELEVDSISDMFEKIRLYCNSEAVPLCEYLSIYDLDYYLSSSCNDTDINTVVAVE